MRQDQEGRDEAVERDQDRREPAHGVAADGAGVVVEAVDDVAALVLVELRPVAVDDLGEDAGADVVADADTDFQRDPAEQVFKHQAEEGAADHDAKQQPDAGGPVADDDVEGKLRHQAGDQAERRADDAEDRIEDDRPLIALAVGKDPFPVVQDLPEGPVLDAAAQLADSDEALVAVLIPVFHVGIPFCKIQSMMW